MSKVKFGLSNVHIAPLTINNGVYTYAAPFALPGAVNLTLDPNGDSVDFHADNTIYFSDTANNGYTGSIEIAMLNEDFRTKVLGETKDAAGGFTESANDVIKPFAMGFQIEGDEKNRRFWYYNVTVSRPSNNSKTTENSKEPQTDTLNIKSLPRLSDKKVRHFLEENASNTSTYNNYFDSVYEPSASV